MRHASNAYPEDEKKPGMREGGERPHETAQWAYYGPWHEFDAGYLKYRWRWAEADDGGWKRAVIEHQTRNGWAHVGKRINTGVAIGMALAATLIEDLANDLSAEIDHRYGDDVHPAMQGRYDRDMAVVDRAKAFLAAFVERGP